MGNGNSNFQTSLQSDELLCVKIKHISELPMEKSVISEPVYVGNLPWLLSFSKQEKIRHDRSICIILRCNADADQVRKGIIPPCWSCRVSGQLRILSQQPEVVPISENIEDVLFSSGGRVRLYYMFKWSPLKECGYLHNDMIHIEISFKTIIEMPKAHSVSHSKVLRNPAPTTRAEIKQDLLITIERCSKCYERPRLYLKDNRLVCKDCFQNNGTKPVEVEQNSANKILGREMDRQKKEQQLFQFNANRHVWFSFEDGKSMK